MSKTSANFLACLAGMENISSLLIYYIYGWSLYVLISMIPMLGFPLFQRLRINLKILWQNEILDNTDWWKTF